MKYLPPFLGFIKKRKTAILSISAGLLIIANLVVLFTIILPAASKNRSLASTLLAPTTTQVNSGIITQPTPMPAAQIPQDQSLPDMLSGSTLAQGTIVFSMVDGGYSHLFAFTPGQPTLLQLTDSPWDDVSPAIHPTGNKLAYSSHKNGYWDIYVLDLSTGIVNPVTDTADYDGSPSWSPDGSKLVYETYLVDNYELKIADLTQNPIKQNQITYSPEHEYDPDWSADGKTVVYVSSFNDQPSLWTASINENNIQTEPIKVDAGILPRHPVWSPDGSAIAWSAEQDNRRVLFTWTKNQYSQSAQAIVEGDYPTWSPDSQVLFSSLIQPNKSFLAAYSLPFGNLVYPITPASGKITGLDWRSANLFQSIPDWMAALQSKQKPPLYVPVITPPAAALPNRYQVVPLAQVNSPYPMLHDLTDEAFQALRERLKFETGWDVLENLQDSFLPISEISGPGLQENWLYTGRAFSLNPIPLSVDWMVIAKESFGDQTFFHLYIRPLYQDGSMGMPIQQSAWNINARFNNDPASYEDGGELIPGFPSGYWVDLSDLALRYNWERVPATPNWAIYYPGAHFNLFVLRSGLSWKNAMLELYPADIFITPTAQVAFTPTYTPTPKLRRTKVPTITPTATLTPTRRPTWTPLP